MTQPATRHQQARIYRLQYQQIWAVLGLIGVGLLLETFGVTYATKSLALGGLLGYLAQCAFAMIAYRTTGVKAGQAIMLNMYLGQVIKWAMTLIGFALIFMFIKPVQSFLVILGYFILQLVNIITMFRI